MIIQKPRAEIISIPGVEIRGLVHAWKIWQAIFNALEYFVSSNPQMNLFQVFQTLSLIYGPVLHATLRAGNSQ